MERKFKWGIKEIIIVIICVFLVTFLLIINKNKFFKYNSIKNNNEYSSGNVVITESNDFKYFISDDESTEFEKKYFIEGDFLSDGIVTEEEKKAMDNNTKYLQYLVNNSKENQTIQLPSGMFYFSSGGINTIGYENYVIKLKSNVKIIGSGTEETKGKYTILKPYADYGTIQNGLDMFYWNELSDSYGKNPEYIENIYFNNFIIDGEHVRGNVYNTSGKGFMINLCSNCHWDNIIVKNTDGTGFGMDNVINGSITNSVAINCGKNATASDGGASGFGIGTGYSDKESMYISNCKSIGNTKFGFFFEHQGRFSENYESSQSEGFVVVNSYASGNLYNFGGERANDVVYVNCKSEKDVVTTDGTVEGYTKLDVYFSDQSRRVSVVNLDTNNYFEDVKDKSTYYYDAVNWALKNGYTYGISSKEFGVGLEASRAEAVTMLWRMAERPGDVLDADELSDDSRNETNIITGFDDILGNEWYAAAVKWALQKKITFGTSNNKFNPNNLITRGEFITMLWRYAGSNKTQKNNYFTDVSINDYYYDAVNWAYEKGLISDTSNNKFNPSLYCTREQIVTFLYRYQNSIGNIFPIRYLLMGGNTNTNSYSYLSGSDNIIVNNPSKIGYSFIGWIGSNGSVPNKNLVVNNNTFGNQTYVAIFKKNS